ncbi:MAG: phytanoyl-CoA dioxygenase family protein [Candidatus Poribacteria bacterium]|nr:phytanoyl-CoA dioxygenase family protein [Candidatus Poribacteria bacterium]
MTTITPTLSAQQIADYNEEGYLIVRNVLSPKEADELRRVVQKEVQRDAYPSSLTYPQPAKYTVSGNRLAAPGLTAIAEHPTVVSAVESALGQPAHLTAYVAYLRTPGDKGAGAHCDYKRWRPVGSSMNWVFAIIPLTDFDEAYGPFLVSPKSHKLTQVIDPDTHILDLTRPDAKQLPPFIDPELKAGDLLVVNEHVWHKAPAGTTTEDRCGIFNKYCAIDAPPAAGYYPYNPAAFNALSDDGKRLIPACFDKPITTTRLLIEHPSGQESKFLLRRDTEKASWELPGGEGWEEEKLVGWDVGARIGSLQELTQTQLDLEVSWMSYIEDVEEGDGICRIYGFSDDNLDLDALADKGCGWFTKSELQKRLGESDVICHAIDTWQQTDVIRGKGKACNQSRQQFE